MKSLCKFVMVGTIVAAVGLVVQSKVKFFYISSLTMENIEALASPEFEVVCPNSSIKYGNCRELVMIYKTNGQRRAECAVSPDPHNVCTYSLEAEANRYL